MSSGLVYLRPARAHFVRDGFDAEKQAADAWGELWSVIAANSVANEDVTRLFGLRWPAGPYANDNRDARYDIGVEFSETIEAEKLTSLRVIQMPGGTFVRSRHKGSLQDIPEAISGLQENAGGITSFRPDDTRPVIEIHLKWSNDPFATSCSELLVPIVATT